MHDAAQTNSPYPHCLALLLSLHSYQLYFILALPSLPVDCAADDRYKCKMMRSGWQGRKWVSYDIGNKITKHSVCQSYLIIFDRMWAPNKGWL